MISFYKRFVSRQDLCFDIGANIGNRTAYLSKTGARIIAVEPQKSCISILSRRFSHQKNIEIVCCALGRNSGFVDFNICEETDQCSSLSIDFIQIYAEKTGLHWTKTESVEMKTLENLCEQYGLPVFCKIDVEGFESEVFLGLNSPIPIISFEFNFPLLSDTEKSLEILEKIGNYSCNFIRFEKMKLVLPEWKPISQFRKELRNLIGPEILTGEIIVKI